MCEVWNAKIVEYRGRPILTMMEELRCYIMRKMVTHKKKLESYTGHLAPVQQKKLDEVIKPRANKWKAAWACDNERVIYEVRRREYKLGVNIQTRTCTCNAWQLTGMPCVHTVAALYKIGLKPEDFVHKWLTMDSIRATYAHFIKPVNSEHYWTPTDCPMTLPPPIKKPAHRPTKKRRADVAVEKEMNANKVRKTFEVTCNKCGQNGHYYRTCKNPPLDPNWKPMTKKERRAAQGKSTSATKKSKDTNSQIDPPSTNDFGNVNTNNVDPIEKAKKNKKKMPLKPGVRVKQPKERAIVEEIQISQNAPHAEEHGNSSQGINQNAKGQTSGSLGLQPAVRMKQPIIRPQIAPTNTATEPVESWLKQLLQ